MSELQTAEENVIILSIKHKFRVLGSLGSKGLDLWGQRKQLRSYGHNMLARYRRDEV